MELYTNLIEFNSDHAVYLMIVLVLYLILKRFLREDS